MICGNSKKDNTEVGEWDLMRLCYRLFTVNDLSTNFLFIEIGFRMQQKIRSSLEPHSKHDHFVLERHESLKYFVEIPQIPQCFDETYFGINMQ